MQPIPPTHCYCGTVLNKDKKFCSASCWRASLPPSKYAELNFRCESLGLDPKNVRQKCKTYAMAPEDYLTLLEKQNSLCAICATYSEAGLYIDHDHKTGAVRELICGACNHALGSLESPKYPLYLQYLEKHRRWHDALWQKRYRHHSRYTVPFVLYLRHTCILAAYAGSLCIVKLD